MDRRPVYEMIFEYLDEHYDMKSPDTPLNRFYKRGMEDHQYPRLDGPVNPEKTRFSGSQEAAQMVTEFAKAAGADLVGFTTVKDSFVFQGTKIDHGFAVVLAMEMDYERIKTAPDSPSGIEVRRVYWRLGEVTVKVAEFIRSLGYRATAHHPRRLRKKHPTMLHTQAAIEAGLGELGRMALLITEEFGPRVRLATVTTELDLPQAPKKRFGIDKYCSVCRLCQKVCEGNAIPDTKRLVAGVERYVVDPYKCLPYFAKYDGCNLCVSKCTFNRRREDLRRLISKLEKNR